MTHDEVEKAINGLEAGITDLREARAHKLKEAAALLRRLRDERDQAIKASVNASLLVNRKARDEIKELTKTVERLQKERDELFAFDVTIRNKALDEAAAKVMEFDRKMHPEPFAISQAILALKSQEPKND